MRKWVFLFVAMVMVINLAIVGIGCKGKEAAQASTQSGKTC